MEILLAMKDIDFINDVLKVFIIGVFTFYTAIKIDNMKGKMERRYL